jgi:hypothetical protein
MIQQQPEVIRIPKIMTKYIKDAYKTISNIERLMLEIGWV